MDRAGRELERVGPDGQSVVYVRASPDGRKVAASVHNPEKGAAEIWVYDTRSKVNRVVAPGPGIADKPVWSPDGTRLLYSRALGAGPRLYVRGLGEQDREEGHCLRQPISSCPATGRATAALRCFTVRTSPTETSESSIGRRAR